MTSAPQSPPPSGDFEQQANEAAPSLVGEFLEFVTQNKKWWLTPIVLVLLAVAVLLMLGGSAPFIYALF